MKKTLLIVSSLMLASPLALAQDTPDATPPADPAIPATPATPADPAVPAQKDDKDGTKKPRVTGSGKSGGNSVGGTANTESQQGKMRARSSNSVGDFAAFDANGDGKLSKDELAADVGLAGRFGEMDKNSDGSLNRAEFATGLRASPSSGASSSSSSGSKSKRPESEGSNRTQKDDKANQELDDLKE